MPRERSQNPKPEPNIRVVPMGYAPVRMERSKEQADKDFDDFLKAYDPCKGKDCD